MNIALLLGSGISVPAKYPSTEDISKVIFSGDGVIYINPCFKLDKLPEDDVSPYKRLSDERVKRVLYINEILKSEIEHYYHKDRSITYEDIAFIATQLRDSLSGEYDNPALLALKEKLCPLFYESFFIDTLPDIRTEREKTLSRQYIETRGLDDSVQDACNYIADIVGRLLDRAPTTTSHLHFVTELANDRSIVLSGIITLNHDTMLEHFLDIQNIPNSCGFVSNGELVYFDDNEFNDNSKISLVKLHGSTNWYYNSDMRRIVISDPHTNIISPHPWVLVGTHNKMLEYARGIYTSLFYEFIKRLREADVLIISGYSFADKGVNSQIIDWMERHLKNRIVVIHGDPQTLMANARGAMNRELHSWQMSGRLHFVAKYLNPASPVTLAEIKSAIMP